MEGSWRCVRRGIDSPSPDIFPFLAFSSMNFSFGNESIVAQLCALEFAGTIYSRPSIPWIPWRSRIYRINRFLNSFFSPPSPPSIILPIFSRFSFIEDQITRVIFFLGRFVRSKLKDKIERSLFLFFFFFKLEIIESIFRR